MSSAKIPLRSSKVLTSTSSKASSNEQRSSLGHTKKFLKKHGIMFSFVDERAVTDLNQQGFGSFPLEELHADMVACESMFGKRANIPELKKQTEAQEKELGVHIQWVGSEDWNLVLTPAQYDAMEIFVRLQKLFSDETTEDPVGHSVASLFKELGFAVISNNHPLQFTLDDAVLPDIKPDIAANVAEINEVTKEVTSSLTFPAVESTCEFISKITKISGARIGFITKGLPIIVGEYKREERPNKAEDIVKLLLEMRRSRKIMELVWENPPQFSFGLYVAHHEWRWFIMRQKENMFVARQIFHGFVSNTAEKIHMANFAVRLVEYISKGLAEVKVVSEERQEEILKQFRERATCSKTTTERSTNNTTVPTDKPSTSNTRSNPSDKGSKKSSNQPNRKSGHKKGPGRSADKENQSPNYDGKGFGQQNLALCSLFDNVYGTYLDDKQVVIKVGSSRKTQHEVSCYSRFQGRYFATLLDVGKLGKRSCIVLPRYSRLPSCTSAKQLMMIAMQILTGLSTMHDAGFIHGDVKNSNIMWDEGASEIKIIDFETASEVPTSGRVPGQFGTTTYMAPEVLNESWVSQKSDVFSAGLLIASLMYGISLKCDEAREQLLGLVRTKTCSHLATPHLVSILSKMLCVSPDQRISAAAALKALTTRPNPKNVGLPKQVTTAGQTKQATNPLPVHPKQAVFWSDDKENQGQVQKKAVAIGSQKSGLVIRK